MKDVNVTVASATAAEKGLMLPPPARNKRKREQVVLDEDEWTDKLEAIIQRDYFPDLPKLENQLEWLEAVRSKDPSLIRQAQTNIAQRRAGLKTPIGQTPASFATPMFGTGTPGFPSSTAAPTSGNGMRLEGNDDAAPNMSLDAFVAQHTSEDNASFGEILEGINKRKRERYDWLHGQIKAKQANLLLEDSRPLDGFGTSGQPNGALLEWPYEAKNQLFYERQAMPLSEREIADQVQGPPKQIKAANTRLQEIDAAEMPEHRPERGEGYQALATPSFTPGPGQSPIMTWGELGATPVRLDEDVPGSIQPLESGPRFKMPERTSRDVVGHRLAEGARLKLHERAALLSPPILHSIQQRSLGSGGKLGLGRTPRLHSQRAGWSPAAHRLASSRRRHSTPLDNDQLRASYSRKTPALQRSVVAASPALSLSGMTPAIFHGHVQNSKISDNQPTLEENSIRKEALQAFKRAGVKQDTQLADKGITDNLLNF